MKNFGLLMLSAIVGSVITLGIFQYAGLGNKVVKIEQISGPSGLSTNFVDGSVSDAPSSFTQTAEKVMPAVVHIKSTVSRQSTSDARGQNIPESFREFFGDDFFFGPNGQGRRPNQPRVGTGSGVVITQDGYIVTNNHVIDQADEIEVSINDNRTYKATVVGTDPSTDIALIKIDEKGLAHLAMANSDDVRIGEWVLAVGNPFNLNSTVTAGIVSAKARNINILKDRSAIESFIQTDAAVNPGNSGGALVNLEGELIGINTAIASPTGSYSGYSFAVPTSIVRKIVEDLLQYGTVQRGFLGVMIRNLDGNLARELDVDITEGVYIDSLMEGGAAISGGIEKGDIIIKVDGKRVKSSSELQAAIGTRRPGDNVDLTLVRDGKDEAVSITLKNRSGNTDVVREDKPAVISALGASFRQVQSG